MNRRSLFDARLVGVLLCAGVATSPIRAEDTSPPDEGVVPSGSELVGPEPERQATLADAEESLIRGDYETAKAAFEKLQQRDADRVEATLGLTRVLLRTGAYAAAADQLATIADARRVERLLLCIELVRTLGRYDEALKLATEAIQLDDDSAAARLAQARLLEYVGRRDDAITAYRWFDHQLVGRADLPQDAPWLTAAGEGFLRYSVLTQTNIRQRTRHALQEMLQTAYGIVDRTYWPARIVAGDLLRERFNNSEHDGSVSDYEAALRINKNLPEAFVGLGEVALTNWGFEEIESRAEQALAVNPNFAPAIHLLGRKLILERRYVQAIETVERALAVNPRDITALAINAGASACLFDQATVDATLARIAEINPRCAEAYHILGDSVGGIRQYEASERAYLRAIEFEPTDANARTELGMMYMQWGIEDKARDALDAAWVLDPYNERTKFTLELLEQLDKFARFDTEHFIVAYDAARDPGLGEYVAGYLEDIYDEVTGDYDTELPEKTIIELFPTHRAFGVRITGKPWIHTVGACTGRVIAMETPRESIDLMGPYNLAHVLKHEFTHTVTLAATKNRIPHWFTEGLAVYQEDTPRNFDWAQLLADAGRQDQLFTLASIDWGFMRPKRPTDRPMAYAQSEWMVEYIVARWSYDVIGRMLTRYRNGEKQPEVIQAELGISIETFDRDFRAWAKEQIRSWGFDLEPPEDVDDVKAKLADDDQNPALLGRLAKALMDAKDFEQAYEVARRALNLNAEEPAALETLIEVAAAFAKYEHDLAARRAYEDEAMPALDRLLKIDPGHWTALRFRSEIALRRDQRDLAESLLKRLQDACPMDPASWKGLGGIYLERNAEDLALGQLLEYARLQSDDYEVRAEIARIYRHKNRLRDAHYWYRQALSINPFSTELHDAYGDACMQLGDARTALAEYTMLTKLAPDVAVHFSKAAFAAHRLGDRERTRAFALQAVALDPNADAKGLLE